MEGLIDRVPDKTTNNQISLTVKQFAVLLYRKYFHCLGAAPRPITNSNFVKSANCPGNMNTYQTWNHRNENFRFLYENITIFNLPQSDHDYILTSMESEFTVLLSELKSFRLDQTIPPECTSYYSAIKHLDDQWEQCHAIKSEIRVIQSAFLYMKSISKQLQKRILFNTYLGNLRKNEGLISPTNQSEPSIEAFLNPFEFSVHPNETVEQYSASQEIIFSQSFVNSQPSQSDDQEEENYRCQICEINYLTLSGLKVHQDAIHRIVIQLGGWVCLHCKGFLYQSFKNKSSNHQHRYEDGSILHHHVKTIELISDEENLVLALVKSNILPGYLVPMKTEIILNRYAVNGKKFVEEDRCELISAWKEYMEVKKTFESSWSNGRSYNYDAFDPNVIINMIDSGSEWTLIDYLRNRRYLGSATFDQKLNKARQAVHSLSRNLFLDYNMFSRRSDALFVENNSLRTFRPTRDNNITANKISGNNYIYLSPKCLKNYELIAIARAQRNLVKLKELVGPLYKIIRSRKLTRNDVLNLNQSSLNQDECKIYAGLSEKGQIEPGYLVSYNVTEDLKPPQSSRQATLAIDPIAKTEEEIQAR